MSTRHLLLGLLIAVMLLCGGALAYASRQRPANTQLLERCAGVLLIAGLVMLGFVFPFSG